MITMKNSLFILFIISTIIVVNSQGTCRFAPSFTLQEIISSSNQSFIDNVLFWEGNFHSNQVGVNYKCGYTYDGHALNYTTGELAQPLHEFSAPSKESIHLGMLALALNEWVNEEAENYRAINFFHQNITRTNEEQNEIPYSGNSNFDNVITILYRKINTYNQFNQRYPGFGGFHPWVSVNDSGLFLLDGWTDQVPGLDNGEMIWGLYAVYNLLTTEQTFIENYPTLGILYEKYFQLLVDNAMMIFYQPSGYISAVVTINDVYATPTPNNYQSPSGLLNDPYEGELLVVFMDLFCQWPSEEARDQIWINKRELLQSVEFDTTTNGTITVQRGWWFSSHEQWKYLMLPYQEIEINQRVFRNGERARTWFSSINQYPGLFASVTNISEPNQNNGYVSATGISEIAFQQQLTNALVTPYGSFPLFLIDDQPSLGLSWYYTMLIGPSMQNQFGSTESVNIIGTEIAPVITWDSKITTVLSMLGGISNINLQFLKSNGLFERFSTVIDREWSLAFPNLNGENLPFMYPTQDVTIPKILNDFTNCS
ncbi:hypothetical protein RB653_007544 [Dictyostelium firmibasis]|uniref:Endo-beta-1,2-glucanase SGL domain-containing protein n=1 Tax=Dictyostelium firmibasis TaxID=79012 RepID=A0AAN7TUR3_9MYCE